MNTNNTTIVVDAMGGDNSPFKVLKGIEIFNKSHSNTNILLFGDQKIIDQTLKSHSLKLDNIEIFNTTDNIKDNDTANTILRKKKNSSIFQGLTHVKNNKVSSGFVSSIFILEKLNIENNNHHKPAKAIAILDAKVASIPSNEGPSCMITNESRSCKPPPKYPSAYPFAET